MKSFAVAAMAGVAAANPAMLYPRGNSTTSAGNGGVIYTTEVVTAYTTYCPGPTEVVVGDKTHTVTEATTLTITDCPCTITKPVMPTGTSPVTKTKEHEVYTTKVVTAYTTYCPAPTEVVIGTKTHTVTEPTTLTITDCPCTITEPVNPGQTSANPVNPGETNTPVADDCAATCNKALGDCKAQADANQSYCISEYSKCLGYDWSAGDREYATACASGQATNTPPVIVQPTGTKPPAIVETGAAAALKPVGGVVAALAAVAML